MAEELSASKMMASNAEMGLVNKIASYILRF